MKTASGRGRKLASVVLGLAFLFPGGQTRSQEIHRAAAAGDTAAIAAMLAADSTLVEARDDRGRTPLQAAVLAGQDETVRLLLKRGADPNARDERTDQAAVDYAFLTESQRGGATMTRLLLSRGATFDPNAAVRGPVKRLDVAVVFGNLDMVRLLLDAGADPNGPTGYPMKPLASAASRGHAEIVRVLLEAGADPDEPDARGRSPSASRSRRDTRMSWRASSTGGPRRPGWIPRPARASCTWPPWADTFPWWSGC